VWAIGKKVYKNIKKILLIN